jgi:hypothetical protein
MFLAGFFTGATVALVVLALLFVAGMKRNGW